MNNNAGVDREGGAVEAADRPREARHAEEAHRNIAPAAHIARRLVGGLRACSGRKSRGNGVLALALLLLLRAAAGSATVFHWTRRES